MIVWREIDCEAARIPFDAKRFLTNRGLPHLVPDLGIEFGLPFEFNDGPKFQIGVIGDQTIAIEENGEVVSLCEEGNAIFLNSSVVQLSGFIETCQKWIEREEIDFSELKKELALLDPKALRDSDFWMSYLDDLEALYF